MRSDIAEVIDFTEREVIDLTTSETRPRTRHRLPGPGTQNRNAMDVWDVSLFIKQLALPDGFTAPTRLEYEDLVATPLGQRHVMTDLAAVNASWDLIRRTRGGPWPDGEVTEDHNFLDLVWHEREFLEGDSFAYAVHEQEPGRRRRRRYIGCFYLYPMGSRTRLTPRLVAHDVDASWWVSRDAFERGQYHTLHRALLVWLEESFPFRKPYLSNAYIPDDADDGRPSSGSSSATAVQQGEGGAGAR